MSGFYEMSLVIIGYDPTKAPQIHAAAEREWPFTDWWLCGDENQGVADMRAAGQDQLRGGESEQEFTERLSVAIWRANGSYCDVVVHATYLGDLPCELYALDEADYARLIQGKQ